MAALHMYRCVHLFQSFTVPTVCVCVSWQTVCYSWVAGCDSLKVILFIESTACSLHCLLCRWPAATSLTLFSSTEMMWRVMWRWTFAMSSCSSVCSLWSSTPIGCFGSDLQTSKYHIKLHSQLLMNGLSQTQFFCAFCSLPTGVFPFVGLLST